MTADLKGYAHVLEQDPVKKDLLYLGTEQGLWISPDGASGGSGGSTVFRRRRCMGSRSTGATMTS